MQNQPLMKRISKYIVESQQKQDFNQHIKNFIVVNTQTNERLRAKSFMKRQVYQQYFLRDIGMLQRVKCQYLAPYIDLSTRNNLYFIFPYYHEQSKLYQLMKKRKFTQIQAINIVAQVLHAVGCLHQYGAKIDFFSLQNMYLENSQVKIINYGTSQLDVFNCYKRSYLIGKKKINFQPLCSPLDLKKQNPKYEQHNFNHVYPIWQIGVLLYYLVTDMIPYQANTNGQEIQITEGKMNIVFPNELGISNEYQELVKKCLKFKLADRIKWKELATHKLFQDRIEQKLVISEHQIQFAYIMADLRSSVHVKNVNLVKYFKRFPENISQSCFEYILKTLNPKTTKSELQIAVKNFFQNQKEFISKIDILQKIKHYGTKINGVNHWDSSDKQLRQYLSNTDPEYEYKLQHVIKTLRSKNQSKDNYINVEQLSKILFESGFTQNNQISHKFDPQGKQLVLINILIKRMCKIMEVPPVLRQPQHLFIQFSYYLKNEVYAYLIQSYIGDGCDEGLLIKVWQLLEESFNIDIC